MKILAKNKRAYHDFDIDETLIAGLVLTGSETKSAKHGSVSLKGSYVRFKNGEPFLTNAHISHYKPAAENQHEPTRDRKLLLHKNEIKRIISAKQNGRHVVPTALGISRNLVKLEIGIGASRKKHDKRERMKQRDSDLQIKRAIKHT